VWAVIFVVARRRYARQAEAARLEAAETTSMAVTDTISAVEPIPQPLKAPRIPEAPHAPEIPQAPHAPEIPMVLECPKLEVIAETPIGARTIPDRAPSAAQTIPDQRLDLVAVGFDNEIRTEKAAPVIERDAHTQRLDHLLAEMPVPLMLAEPKTGAIQFCNQAFKSSFGYYTDVSASVSVFTLLGAIDEAGRNQIRELASAGRTEVMTIWRADGTTFPARVRGTLHRGEADSMMLMIEDVSSERRTEDQQELLAAAVEAAHDAIMLVDASGTVTHANESAARLYGRELKGSLFGTSHIFELSEDGPVTDALQATLREGAWKNETLRVCDDGACRPTGLSLSRLARPDKDPVVVAVARDLSAQSEMQDEVLRASKLATLGELAGGITHEISNPLTSVLENARYIAESFETNQMDESVAEAAEDTLGAAQRMRAILEEVRRFSHMGAVGCAETTFDAAIGSALILAGPAVRRHARVTKPEGPSPEIWAEQGHLTQVLLNLLKNAAEAMRDMGKIGTIRLEHGQSDSQAFLRIIDDGPGIPEAVQQRLFKEYITTKERGRGTGFGLRLCQKLLTDDGGSIELDSTVGQGATFTIWVPLASAAAEEAAAAEAAKENGVEITMMSELDPETEEALREALSLTMPAPDPAAAAAAEAPPPAPATKIPSLVPETENRDTIDLFTASFPPDITDPATHDDRPPGVFDQVAPAPWPAGIEHTPTAVPLLAADGPPPAYTGTIEPPAMELPARPSALPSPPVLRSRSSEMLVEPSLPVPAAFANERRSPTTTRSPLARWRWT